MTKHIKVATRITVERYFENIIEVAIMTPMGDPLKGKCRMGLPAIFWGLSGIGKSARVLQAAKSVQIPLLDIRPVSIECILPGVRTLIKRPDAKALIFIDEASCATPAVQGAMLGMLLDRRAGEAKIPDGVRMLLAANPPEYAAGGWGLEAPFANRMAHFFIGVPSVDEWINWFYGIHPQVEEINNAEEKLLDTWGKHWGDARSLVTGFIKTRQELLHMQPEAHQPEAGYAWTSPSAVAESLPAARSQRRQLHGRLSDVLQAV